MIDSKQQDQAKLLRSLHDSGVLVLPNAWDAVSAAVIARAGAHAIATTSGGVAWALGRTDGQGLSREEMVEQVRRIAGAVEVPVTADIEGGYGPSPEDVAKTVEGVIDAGAVGVNIEDSGAPGGGLFDVQSQAERLRCGRGAAERVGLPGLVINARTDVFLFGIGDPSGRLDAVIDRASVYAQAGADSLFVPGLTDLETLSRLVKSTSLPVNVMTGPGSPTVAEFAATGVRRVSLGTALAQSAYSAAQRAASEMLATGTYDALNDSIDYSTLNDLFVR